MKISAGLRWLQINDYNVEIREEGLFYPEEQKYFTLSKLKEIVKEMEKMKNGTYSG